MAKVRVVLLSVALVAAAGVGYARAFPHDSTPHFCTLEGAALDGEWLSKNDDCQWIREDGTLVLDKDGNPVTWSTPEDKLPDGWGVSPSG